MDSANYAEFPIKRADYLLTIRAMRLYLERPAGTVFPLRKGQRISFSRWYGYVQISAVGEGYIDIYDEEFLPRRFSAPNTVMPFELPMFIKRWPDESLDCPAMQCCRFTNFLQAS